jgi:hypothetical protein
MIPCAGVARDLSGITHRAESNIFRASRLNAAAVFDRLKAFASRTRRGICSNCRVTMLASYGGAELPSIRLQPLFLKQLDCCISFVDNLDGSFYVNSRFPGD